ncbi:uncharacterized protein G2W53_010152 [Senna tora]|uniref:Uncharacterized protein n=1 Tax=Senna tora TaxID=362788 RepID=A0A834WZM0_9FABA|nr:uncharacterized protein G2W53_010152 [Senna tora]
MVMRILSEKYNNLWYGRLCGNALGLCGRREVEVLLEEAKLQKKNRRSQKKKVSHISRGLLDKKYVAPGVPNCTSISNTAIHGCIKEAWLSSSRKNQSRKKRTDGLRRRVSSRISKGSFQNELLTLDVPDCSSIANPAIHGVWDEGGCLLQKKQSRKRTTYGFRRRLSSRISMGSFDKKPVKPGVPDCSSFANPAFLEIIADA